MISILGLLAASALGGADPAPAPAAGSLLERAAVLDQGVNGVRDAAMTAEAYRIAAETGDSYAHLRLGYLFETGDGVPQDYVQARAHYQVAVAAGLNEARLRLAICYLEGWGDPADRAAFAREMKVAAESGYAPAQQILGSMYFIGLGVPMDRQEGLNWLEKAAKGEDSLSQLQIGQELERARRLTLSPDMSLVRSWYQLSAEKEYVEGTRAMARTFLGGERKDRNWAMGQRWLQLATDMGDPEAPYTLAICELLHVDSPVHDVNQARAWLKLASERGNNRATELLQLELSGRTLVDAAQYILREPFEERYLKHIAASAASTRDLPTRIPEIYRMVTPVYPRGLRLEGVNGEVTVDFIVDTTGRVQNARSVKATHAAFGERAVEAVRQWRFYPARKDGRLVNTHMQVPVRFELSEERLDGTDNVMHAARDLAERYGSDAFADAVTLRPAEPLDSMRPPVMPDGSAIPKGAMGMLLLVLDSNGTPMRGYVLDAKPEAVGPVVFADVMKHRFKPRTEGGSPVQTNVVFVYRFGQFDDQVFKLK